MTAKSVRSMVAMLMLLRLLTTEVSPEMVMVEGSIVMEVFSSVAPAP